MKESKIIKAAKAAKAAKKDEFSTRRCDCCGSNLAGQRDYFIVLGE